MQPRRRLMKRAGGNASNWLILALLCAAQFMVVLDFSIVNVALPSIQHTFDMSQDRLQWLVSAYALTFGGFLLLGGRAADLLGRRRMFMVGLILFAGASLLGGFAPSPWLLLAARALQGIGAAVLSPAALSLVTSIFREGRDRHRALGIFGALGAGGFAIGVFLGGVLTDGPGWRWVFYVNVPIGLLAALLSPYVLPSASRQNIKQRDLDVPGAITGTAGLGLLMFGLTQAPTWSWTSIWTWLCILAAFGLLVVFANIEQRARAPLFRMALLRKRSVAISDLVALMTTAATAPQIFVLSVYLQTVLAYSAFQTGLMFLVQGITAVLGGVIGSRGVSKFGVRPMLVGGRLAAGLAVLILLPLPERDASPVRLVAALAVVGLGNICTFVATSIGATGGIEPGELGVASGVLYSAQQIGAALGISILVALAETRTRMQIQTGAEPTSAMVDGFRFALGGAAVICVAAAMVALSHPGTSQRAASSPSSLPRSRSKAA